MYAQICHCLLRLPLSLESQSLSLMALGNQYHILELLKFHHLLFLNNILHVPSFRFNLISVCTLLRDNHLSAHFYPDHCFIHESTQGSMFGRRILLHNLYVLEPATSVEFCGSLQVDGNLWHQHLGHPLTSKLKHLTSILPITASSLHKYDMCSVCPLTKEVTICL